MTKFYTINLIENSEIEKLLVHKSASLNLDFVKYLDTHFILQDQKDKIKIIDGNFYELLKHTQKNTNAIKEISKQNEAFKILYSDYIITLFNNQVIFTIQEMQDSWINDDFKNRFWKGNYFVITDEMDKFNALKEKCFIKDNTIFKRNEDYQLAFNDKNFILFDTNLSKATPSNSFCLTDDSNILKILIIQLIALSYKNINLSVKEKLQNEFDSIKVEEILALRKKFFSYKIITNYEIKEDRKEANKIFTLVKNSLKFEEAYDEISKNLSDFFEIISEETKIKDKIFRKLELERIQIEQNRKEQEKEKREKFNSKITLIAAVITILTFISVVADIFNLFDRFFK